MVDRRLALTEFLSITSSTSPYASLLRCDASIVIRTIFIFLKRSTLLIISHGVYPIIRDSPESAITARGQYNSIKLKSICWFNAEISLNPLQLYISKSHLLTHLSYVFHPGFNQQN